MNRKSVPYDKKMISCLFRRSLWIACLLLSTTSVGAGIKAPAKDSGKKDSEGRWVEVGGGGMGCLETRPGTLNKVTRNAAWYEGFVATLKVVCASPFKRTDICLDGGSRVCKKCNSLRLEVRSISPG